MDQRPWQRGLKHAYMRGALKRYRWNRRRRSGGPLFRSYGLVTAAVALVVTVTGIGMLEARLGPVLETAARTQTKNQISACLEQAISEDLLQRQISYSDFITI